MKKKKFKILNYVAVAFAFLFSFFLLGNNEKVSAAESQGQYCIVNSKGVDVGTKCMEYYENNSTKDLYVYVFKTESAIAVFDYSINYYDLVEFPEENNFSVSYDLYEDNLARFFVAAYGTRANEENIKNALVGDYFTYYNGVENVISKLNKIDRLDYMILKPEYLIGEDAYYGNLKIVVTVNDTVVPVIEGTTTINVNIDSPVTIEQILQGYNAIDETDGNVSIYVKEDNYSANKNKKGIYTIILGAKDAAENEATLTLTINVRDITSPTINGTSSYNSNMSSPISLDTIKNGLSATDNVDTNLTITLHEDNFTGHEQEVGSFTVIYKTTDSSGNSDLYTVTITNIDDIKPTLSISGSNEFNVSSTTTLSVDEVLKKITASDNIDEELTINVLENNYNDTSVVGTYTIKFNVTDSNGNTSDELVVNVIVFDNIAPVFYVKKEFIAVKAENVLTYEQLVNLFAQINDIDTNTLSAFKVVQDTYSSNASKVGTYNVELSLKTNSNQIITLSSVIEVLGDETQSDIELPSEEEKKEDTIIDITDDDKKFLEELKDFFVNIWNTIKEFFVKLWNSIVKYIAFGWLWDDENKFDVNWKEWN